MGKATTFTRLSRQELPLRNVVITYLTSSILLELAHDSFFETSQLRKDHMRLVLLSNYHHGLSLRTKLKAATSEQPDHPPTRA
jgi:hypothetical protein